MKKLLVLLVLHLALATSALGQSVGASQIKKKANGGLVADSANALTVAVHRATSAPSSPIAGMLWCDTTTTPCSMKSYSGSAWTSSPNTAVMTQATLATLPGSPVDGQIVWVSSQARAIVYVGSESKWYYLDATNRSAQADYSIDTAGYSTAFLTAPGATTGSIVTGGAMTVGTHLCATSFYNATGGETMIGAPTETLTVGTNKTAALTIPTGDANTAGRRVYCTKANVTTPYFLVASIDDNTTGTYSVTVADASFLGNASPDKNFSAPLPAGWTYYAPDRSYGGCGSTGATLLCSVVKNLPDSSTTSAGVRLFYEITSTPAAWRASWQVSRVLGGFPGSIANAFGYGPIATVSADAAAVAPVMATMHTYRDYTQPVFPWTAVFEPAFSTASRSSNTAWASTLSDSRPSFVPISTPAVYVMVRGINDGSEYSVLFGASPNGVDFVNAYAGLAGVYIAGDYRPCTTGSWCSATKPNYVGIGIEVVSGSGASLSGMVYELERFRWASE